MDQETKIVSSPASVLSEAELLRARAKKLGISLVGNPGVQKLKALIAEKMLSTGEDVPLDDSSRATETVAQKRERIRKQALRLVRCRIQCLNPLKKNWPGEILCIANDYIGNVKKFIPYQPPASNAWHIPYCIYKHMKDKKIPQIMTIPNPDPRGLQRTIRRTVWVPEYALQELPPLTKEELSRLADIQRKNNALDGVTDGFDTTGGLER